MEQEQFKKEIIPLRGQLAGYAQRMLADKADAEDVVQEVFLKLWYMRVELKRYDNVPALATTITKHLCLNRIKVNQRKAEDLSDTIWIDEAITPHQQLEEKDAVGYVMRIISRLPDLQQTILRMKHVDGFEVEEIAELTGGTPDSVRMNLSRARRKVKELVSKTAIR